MNCAQCGGDALTSGYQHRPSCPSLAQSYVFAGMEMGQPVDTMTPRDWFAAFALAGMYASGQLGSGDTADVLAVESYRLADALLQAREGTP